LEELEEVLKFDHFVYQLRDENDRLVMSFSKINDALSFAEYLGLRKWRIVILEIFELVKSMPSKTNTLVA